MTKNIYLSPKIFPTSQILSGITLKDEQNYPPYGFSITKAEILSDEDVNRNRIIFAKNLNWELSKIKFQKQISTNNVNIISKNSKILEADGMVTDEKGLMLVLSLADCCGILIYSPDKNVIAALHSGWNGTRLNIVESGLKILVNKYSVNVESMLVWITPCAGKDDYEIGEDVAKYFPDFITPINNGKYLLDLKGAIFNQLTNFGVKSENIEISQESTISDLRFHSYRRDKSKSGRMAAFIALLP